MGLASFHPIVSQWFSETLGEPTAAQAHGWAAIRERRHTLIAAPTGSGKTLAAFLTALDDLVQEGLRGAAARRSARRLRLAAQGAERRHPQEPRRAAPRHPRGSPKQLGSTPPRITAAVRTGDTPQSERAAMLRTPPHILVTTPESLYLLLTAERSREMLRTVRTVIVDEIHAVIGTRRGAHLALSLERLQQVAERPLLRIGLSATQKPIEEVARFLVGTADRRAGAPTARSSTKAIAARWTSASRCRGSPLEAVMSHEVWEEYYDRLTELIDAASDDAGLREHAADGRARGAAPERAARRGRGDRAPRQPVEGEAARRRDAAEEPDSCKALVATASLELGIDIGHVDLVCQIGSPHRIATLLQRVGRSGHTDRRHAEGAAVPDVARRSGRVRGAAARGPPRRARSHRHARRAARRAGAADRRRDGLPRVRRGRAVRAGARAPGRIAI